MYISPISVLRHIPRAVGIELTIFSSDKIRMRTAMVTRKINKVNYIQGEYAIGDIEDLKKYIPLGTPLALSLNGKGLIHRKVQAVENENALQSIFPDANAEDYFIQEVVVGPVLIISLIKQGELRRIMAEFKKAGLTVLSVSLGPFAILPLLPLIKNANGAKDLEIAEHAYFFENGVFQDYLYKIEDNKHYARIQISEEELDERLFTAFASAFCLISDIKIPQPETNWADFEKDEYQSKLQFKRSSIAILCFFLLALLTNSFVFMDSSRKLENVKVVDISIEENKIERLKAKLLVSNEIISRLNINEKGYQLPISLIADKFALSLPSALLLEEILFFPKALPSGGNSKLPYFDHSLIQITGETATIESLNQWVKAISNMSFCKNITIENYTVENESYGRFLIFISI